MSPQWPNKWDTMDAATAWLDANERPNWRDLWELQHADGGSCVIAMQRPGVRCKFVVEDGAMHEEYEVPV